MCQIKKSQHNSVNSIESPTKKIATSHHITSHHITSHHITSLHITSHHITSHHITSHHITSHHITSHHITSHHIKVYSFIEITSDLPHMFTIKVQAIRTAAHRPSTQASYMIGSGMAMQENQQAAQIAAKHNIIPQMAPYMS